ncbi:MAG: hypothetical protein GY804_13540 [Alphaproteobacteria bacterium]|nr:hypothetical protein [Alphaproteobacteria bacterium]
MKELDFFLLNSQSPHPYEGGFSYCYPIKNQPPENKQLTRLRINYIAIASA